MVAAKGRAVFLAGKKGVMTPMKVTCQIDEEKNGRFPKRTQEAIAEAFAKAYSRVRFLLRPEQRSPRNFSPVLNAACLE